MHISSLNKRESLIDIPILDPRLNLFSKKTNWWSHLPSVISIIVVISGNSGILCRWHDRLGYGAGCLGAWSSQVIPVRFLCEKLDQLVP